LLRNLSIFFIFELFDSKYSNLCFKMSAIPTAPLLVSQIFKLAPVGARVQQIISEIENKSVLAPDQEQLPGAVVEVEEHKALEEAPPSENTKMLGGRQPTPETNEQAVLRLSRDIFKLIGQLAVAVDHKLAEDGPGIALGTDRTLFDYVPPQTALSILARLTNRAQLASSNQEAIRKKKEVLAPVAAVKKRRPARKRVTVASATHCLEKRFAELQQTVSGLASRSNNVCFIPARPVNNAPGGPCRNGLGCTRKDCHFSHPNGWTR
jgi:hypothetical protein